MGELPLLAVVSLAILGGCVLLLAARITWWRPEWGLASAFAFVLVAGTKFRQRDAAASLAGNVDAQIAFELALYAALAVVLLTATVARRSRLTANRQLGTLEILLAGYVSWAALSTLWSLAPAMTMVRAGQLALLLALAVISVRLLGPDRVVRVAASAFVAYVLAGAFAGGLERVLTGAGQGERFSWFALPPVTAGTYAGLALVLTAAKRVAGETASSRPRPVFFWVSMLALFGVLVATGARGPLLAFLVASVVLLLRRRSPSVATALVSSTTVVLVVAIHLIPADLVERLADSDHPVATTLFRGQSLDQVLGVSGRAELWEEVAPLVLERPLTGRGFQGSRMQLLEVAPWAGYAHNAYLQTLLDLGIAGAVLLWPVLFAMAVFPLRGGGEGGLDPARTTIFAATMFLIVNALSSESFAAAPGIETLFLFTGAAALGPARRLLRRPARAPISALGPTTVPMGRSI